MKITSTQYAQTLLELAENKSQEEISDIVKKFAEVLKNDGQLKNAGKIMEKFSELYNAKHGIIEASVTTRFEMGDRDLREVEKFIKEKYDAKKVEIKNTVDTDIKGGIIIKVGDEVLDGSVVGKLNSLKKVLI